MHPVCKGDCTPVSDVLCRCVCVHVAMYISLHVHALGCMHYLVHGLGCMSCTERHVGMYAHCSWCIYITHAQYILLN